MHLSPTHQSLGGVGNRGFWMGKSAPFGIIGNEKWAQKIVPTTEPNLDKLLGLNLIPNASPKIDGLGIS